MAMTHHRAQRLAASLQLRWTDKEGHEIERDAAAQLFLLYKQRQRLLKALRESLTVMANARDWVWLRDEKMPRPAEEQVKELQDMIEEVSSVIYKTLEGR